MYHLFFLQDYILLIPKLKWTSNIISPSFYCSRRLSRCIDSSFPTPSGSLYLEASKALRVITSVPPDSHPATKAVLMTSRRQVGVIYNILNVGGIFVVVAVTRPS